MRQWLRLLFDAAEEALARIEVDYEELSAVFHPEQAMEAGQPLIHEDKERNIAAHIQYNAGDVDEAVRQAAHVFEDDFETSRQAHLCMEPHVCAAQVEPSGRITFYYSTQAPSYSRSQMAKILKVPESQIRVVTPKTSAGASAARPPESFASTSAPLSWPARQAVR